LVIGGGKELKGSGNWHHDGNKRINIINIYKIPSNIIINQCLCLATITFHVISNILAASVRTFNPQIIK
jgi:hypothetical protein